MLQIVLNGEITLLPAEVHTVASLLTHFGLQEKMLIVEHDGRILDKAMYTVERLSEGSRIEIVHFVGGG